MPIRRRITGQNRPISVNFVGYARISTPQQRSAQGQEAAIRAYAEECGGELLGFYSEIARDTDEHQGERTRAIAHAIRAGATLLVLWPDRLTRGVNLLDQWRAQGLCVRAVAFPLLSPEQFRRRVLIAYAENEERAEQRELARDQARREGRPLGDPTRGLRRTIRADNRDELILALLRRAFGARFHPIRSVTLQEIADQLTNWQVRKPSGRVSPWEPTQVRRILQKASVIRPDFSYRYTRTILRSLIQPNIFQNDDAYERWMAEFCGGAASR